MNILFVIQRLQLRGAEIFASQLAIELNATGHTVHLAYLFSDNDQLPGRFPQLKYIPLHASKRIRFFDFGAFNRLNDLIRHHNYDIVQANAGDTLKYAALSRFICGWKKPLVYRNANKMGDFIKGYFQKIVNQFLLSQCSHFISVSENCRRDLIELYSPAERHSTTVEIGTYLFDNIVPRLLQSAEPAFLNIGSFVPEKNHLFLLEVFHRYYALNKIGFLHLVGDGYLKSQLQDRVKHLGLQDRVIFHGYQKDVIPLLKSATVFIMTSTIEGLPGVILEAFSCRIPVIAPAVGGIPEFVQDGVTGFCVRSSNPDEYVTHMDELVKDDRLRDYVTCQGRALIEKRLLMPVIAKRFSAIYNSKL
jgi:glycosyltransferase involved in cell wall biosynthesis